MAKPWIWRTAYRGGEQTHWETYRMALISFPQKVGISHVWESYISNFINGKLFLLEILYGLWWKKKMIWFRKQRESIEVELDISKGKQVPFSFMEGQQPVFQVEGKTQQM